MASMLYQHLPQVVGIVGAGQMGSGIAQVVACRGLTAILHDASKAALSRGSASVERSLERLVGKPGGLSADDAAAALGRIHTTHDLESMRDADFVFEAAPEDEVVKCQLFRRLDAATPLHTILASNTSTISITRIAAATLKPHRVVGMHFFHPAPVMPLVEVVRGLHTGDGTFGAATALARHLGKQVVVAADRPGFVVNRLLLPQVNDAFQLLMEGCCGGAADIDRAMALGTYSGVGPLKMGDLVGLDTVLSGLKVMAAGLGGGGRYQPCPLLVQYVDAGWLGVKSGRGVYQYDFTHASAEALLPGKRPPAELAADVHKCL